MIDKTNFLEPTPEYAQQFKGMSPEQIKDWFNLDLIFITSNYAQDIIEHVKEFYDYFNHVWVGEYKIGLTIEEVQEHLKDYSKETTDEMLPQLIRALDTLRETENSNK